MITKYKYLNFYYNSLEKFNIINLIKILFFNNNNSNINNYFKKNFNSKEEYFFLSARSALYFFLKNINNNSKSSKGIIVTSFTCDSVVNSVINSGFNPILIDIESDNYSIDLDDLKSVDLSTYSIILLQHTFGLPAKYINEIVKFGKINKKIIIEDCSLSLFAKFNGKSLGSFGDASIFSFELSKSITTQRGGCLIINNDAINLNNFNLIYKNTPRRKKLLNFKKSLQIILSSYIYNSKFYNIWFFLLKFLYNTHIFEKSTPAIENKGLINNNYLEKMDENFKNLLIAQLIIKDDLIKINKDNLNYIYSKVTNQKYKDRIRYLLNFNYLIRLPLEIDNKENFINYNSNNYKIEIGYWFKNISKIHKYIKFNDLKFDNKFCDNSEIISNKMINIPLSINQKYQYYYDDLIDFLNNE